MWVGLLKAAGHLILLTDTHTHTHTARRWVSSQISRFSDAPLSEALRENIKSTSSFWRFRGNVLALEYMPKGGKEKKSCKIGLSQMQMKLNPLRKLKYYMLGMKS